MKLDQQVEVPAQVSVTDNQLITLAYANQVLGGSCRWEPLMTGGPSSEMILDADGDAIVAQVCD